MSESPVDASSSLVMENAVASTTAGSGPPRTPVSIAAIAAMSSTVSTKSNRKRRTSAGSREGGCMRSTASVHATPGGLYVDRRQGDRLTGIPSAWAFIGHGFDRALANDRHLLRVKRGLKGLYRREGGILLAGIAQPQQRDV